MSPVQMMTRAIPVPAGLQHTRSAIAAPTGFWQRRFVQDFLPFLTSLSLHAAILIIGLLTYTAIQIIRQPLQVQVAPGDFEMRNVLPGTFGTSDDKTFLRTQQDQFPDSDAKGISFTPGSKGEIGGGSDGAASVLASGASAGFNAGSGLSLGKGGKFGSGEGPGSAAPYGTPQIGARGPMFGNRPEAHKIAYVCDASGSMINKMASLKMELNKAIGTLKLTQSFSIIFFRDTTPMTLDRDLVPATPQYLRKAGIFLEDVTSAGTTNPIPGIEAAFRQQPELIYLLTDGDFPDNQAVLDKINQLNKGKKVRINTIAFVGSGDSDTEFLVLLKRIAAENGGAYRHVSEQELQ